MERVLTWPLIAIGAVLVAGLAFGLVSAPFIATWEAINDRDFTGLREVAALLAIPAVGGLWFVASRLF